MCTRVSHFCASYCALLLFPCPISHHSSRNIFHLLKIYMCTKVRNCDAHRCTPRTQFHYRFFENLRLERHNMRMNLLILYKLAGSNYLSKIYSTWQIKRKKERTNLRMFHNFENLYYSLHLHALSRAFSNVIKCICLAIRRKNFK